MNASASAPTTTHASHRVVSFAIIDKANARLAVRCTKQATASELGKLNTKLLERGLVLVAGSGRVIDKSGPRDLNHMVSVVAAVRPVTQVATEATLARYIALASSSNMFLDPETNKTWIQADGVLRRRDNIETEEHLASLLASVCPTARSHEGLTTASAISGVATGIESGRYCEYLNGFSTSDGYIIATATDGSEALIADRANKGNAVNIKTSMIIEAFDVLDDKKQPLTYPNAERDMKKILAGASASEAVAYYKQVYGYNTAYWARFSALLKSRGVY